MPLFAALRPGDLEEIECGLLDISGELVERANALDQAGEHGGHLRRAARTRGLACGRIRSLGAGPAEREIHDGIDLRQQPVGLIEQDVEIRPQSLRPQVFQVFEQHLAIALDRVDRGAQVMAQFLLRVCLAGALE